jgi:murein tripeptide amidase MpaA
MKHALPLVLLLLVSLMALAAPYARAQDLGDHDVVSFENTPEIMEKLQRLHLDLLMEKEGRVYAVVGVSDLLRLQQEFIPFAIETLDFPPYSDKHMSVHSGINGQFYSYKEVVAELMNLEQTFPDIVQVVDIGDSFQNRDIYAIKLSDNVITNEDEAEVVFLGCHHAREWIAVDVPIRIARRLATGYASDDRIRSLLDRSEVWIVPIVNPDGLEYSIYVYRYWRKNRRMNADGSYGVDLNRNYSYQWGYDNIGSSSNPVSNTYRGTAPFSEPETRAVRDFVQAHDFQVLISFHNFTQIILYPWGYIKALHPEDDLLEYLAANMVSRMAEVNGRVYDYGPAGYSLYTTNGDTTDWALGEKGIPAFTVELPPPSRAEGGFFNDEDDIVPITEENMAAAMWLIEWAIDNHGTKSVNGTAEASGRRMRKQNRRRR